MTHRTRITSLAAATLALATAALLLPAAGPAQADPARHGQSDKRLVERGRYLVATSGCGDCHTPLKLGERGPEPDLARALSGHPAGMALPPAPRLPAGPWIVSVAATNTAWAGPWGVSFTANLTPDAETGLGRWTFEDFRDTLRTGRHQGRGREVLPPMPIVATKHFNDADLKAIWAYLRSVPAVNNRVPEPLPPSP
jgi:mono/diheme cytochrome c family protein